jgi:hypothetical protein
MRASRPRPRGPYRFVAVLTAVPLLAACSGGPAPRAWAASVCQALAPWRSESSTLTARTQQQITTESTPAQAKENLVLLFQGAQTASETARAGVARAGVPDVEQGRQIAEGFQASLGAVRDAYGRARTGIEGLPTEPPDTFYTRVGEVVKTLQEEYDRSALDTSRLDSAELKRAFDEVPECR